eukprot:scaffold70281_cov67-Cyclotella_meneghiniana.AAC.11
MAPILPNSLRDYAKDLCCGDDTSEFVRLLKLRVLFKNHPHVVREKDRSGRTLLHIAARHRSPKFCKAIIDLYAESVTTIDSKGWIPIHCACGYDNFETVK